MRHYRMIHGEEYVKEELLESKRCTAENCEEVFCHKMDLLDHMQEKHAIDLSVQSLAFSSEIEFLAWKEAEESLNFIYYSKQRGDFLSSEFRYVYFCCQHDGPKRGTETRTERKSKYGTVKTGLLCPSLIYGRVNLRDGKVEVRYVRSHSHPIGVENTIYQPIPKPVREEIKTKLAVGVPVNSIYHSVRDGKGMRTERDNPGLITKAHLIKKRNICDIKRRIGIGLRLHPDDSTATYMLVKKLQQEQYQPCLLYTSPSPRDGLLSRMPSSA